MRLVRCFRYFFHTLLRRFVVLDVIMPNIHAKYACLIPATSATGSLLRRLWSLVKMLPNKLISFTWCWVRWGRENSFCKIHEWSISGIDGHHQRTINILIVHNIVGDSMASSVDIPQCNYLHPTILLHSSVDERAGLVHINQQTSLLESWQPYFPANRVAPRPTSSLAPAAPLAVSD